MKDGLIRIAAATPETGVADVKANIARMGELAREAAQQGCAAVVSVSGFSSSGLVGMMVALSILQVTIAL